MRARKITEGVYWVGAVDWDRAYFDALIELPDGTSYNAYLVQGSDKTALIDTVDPEFSDLLFDRLEKLNTPIDYIIANHAEQDHSGTLPQVLEMYPDAPLVCTEKCKAMLVDLGLANGTEFITVEDGETISLGDRTLEFIHAPWVHWPETMLTYLQEDQILFPCDLFGSHLATTDLYGKTDAKLYDSAKRYFAEIMMPFRKIIKGHMEKLENYEFSMIAPSHGPIYDNPDFILDAYDDWINGEPKNAVVLPFISMHGSTEKMVDHLLDALVERGVKVHRFNMEHTPTGELAMALVDAATLVVGSPTFLTGAHPKIVYPVYLANAIRPKTKFISVIGSYGWGGKMAQQLTEMTSLIKAEQLDPVLIKGDPTEEDFAALDELADQIADKHASLGE